MAEANEKDEILDVSHDESSKKVLNYLKDISNNINSAISLLESCSSENKAEVIQDVSSILENSSFDIPKAEKKAEDYKEDALLESYKENTLVISYFNNNVTLPYTLEELNSILALSEGQYTSVEEIIDDIYTIPLEYYKHTPFARFKEAFRLVRERNNGSLKDALELAIEAFSNYNLHPAIISACKNIDEFDVYLSCLEYNELEDFHFFNIEFIMPPLTIKKQKEDYFM